MLYEGSQGISAHGVVGNILLPVPRGQTYLNSEMIPVMIWIDDKVGNHDCQRLFFCQGFLQFLRGPAPQLFISFVIYL